MAKVLKNGLKSRDFERRGVHRSGWWASLFCVFDAADSMAIDTIWQNLGLLPKGLVLPNCMGFAEMFGISPKGLRNL